MVEIMFDHRINLMYSWLVPLRPHQPTQFNRRPVNEQIIVVIVAV